MITRAAANERMLAAWDGDEGEGWARDWVRYDRAVAAYESLLRRVAAVAPDDDVLDVGCGVGESARAAARAAETGSVLGVDLSSRMIERARDLARAEGQANLSFERADAQVHAFDPERFDVAVSRFGAMFFDDRMAAFANIARAVRPGGRLVLVAWRRVEDNEWIRSVLGALAVGGALTTPPPGAPGPFGMADPDRNRDDLEVAGFEAVEHHALDEPFWSGHDADDTFGFLGRTGMVRSTVAALDEPLAARALDRLRRVVDDHDTGRGVVFGSGAWLITARRARRGSGQGSMA